MCTATGWRKEERSKEKEETLKRWTDSGIGGKVKQAWNRRLKTESNGNDRLLYQPGSIEKGGRVDVWQTVMCELKRWSKIDEENRPLDVSRAIYHCSLTPNTLVVMLAGVWRNWVLSKNSSRAEWVCSTVLKKSCALWVIDQPRGNYFHFTTSARKCNNHYTKTRP